MKKSEVVDMFYTQRKVSFSKGYDIFEKVYEELKDKLNLKRVEIEHPYWTEVIIYC